MPAHCAGSASSGLTGIVSKPLFFEEIGLTI
jgi:hypothetical protein